MAEDFYKRIIDLLGRPHSPCLYKELYCILHLVCEEFCGQRVFSNFFSQLGFVCEYNKIAPELTRGLQNLRRKVGRSDLLSGDDFAHDARLLTSFIHRLYGISVPTELTVLLPSGEVRRDNCEPPKGEYKVLRVRALDVDDQYIYGQCDELNAQEIIKIDYVGGGIEGDLAYIRRLITRNTTLNLLKVRVSSDFVYTPYWIIYEPDYLMSPSELAGVFEVYGASPMNYLIKAMSQNEATTHILLGNASGVFLDDLLFGNGSTQPTYTQSISKAFRKYPLEFSLTIGSQGEAMRFHSEAQAQFNNIKQLVENQLKNTYGFDLDKALLEPSFVCPAVGLAGRMDYLQSDATRLIEQKSGKRDEYRKTHREPHFVQMMLYQLILEFTVGINHKQCEAYLLYSRYADGLMFERPYITLLRRAIEMRNRIVCMQKNLSEGALSQIMSELSIGDLRTNRISDKLWSQYIAPRLNEVADRFHQTKGSLAHAYVCRFYHFLAKEQWLARMGNGGKGSHGYADLWNNPALVRMENGDMFGQLKVSRLEGDDDSVEIVVFEIPDEMRQTQTNFRQGDAIQIYSYEGNEPNVSTQFTLRGKLSRLLNNEVEVVLSNPQRNTSIFAGQNKTFALEHDHIESGTTTLYRSLSAFLGLGKQAQNRFLLTSLPEMGKRPELVGKYGQFDTLVSKERAARDFFLVIGPPGSGKTSRAIRYMVEEELSCSQEVKILLMAYTNRAVDELCEMLEDIICDNPTLLSDYLRIGHKLSASPQYRGRILQQRVEAASLNAADIKTLLGSVSIIVGTVSTMSQQQQLLDAIPFGVAFIDEASQILEPYLLPVYTAGKIGRFVLVGDQKQLPAVVQQDIETSAISHKELNSIGLTNCANSLFDRMLHRFMSQGRTDLYHQLTTQGRMHPDIFEFVNQQFYGDQLRCVPLGHQMRSIGDLYANLPTSTTPLLCKLASKRVLFLDCKPQDDGVNDKVNSAEAQIVVECLKSLQQLYKANSRPFGSGQVGIIVPYRNQISMIRNCMQTHGLTHLLDITIDTVERYQGSQRDVIIYSLCVRHQSQLGFLTSATYIENDQPYGKPYNVDRKLNVALTRSREQLIIIGNKDLLKSNRLFRQLTDFADPDNDGSL